MNDQSVIFFLSGALEVEWVVAGFRPHQRVVQGVHCKGTFLREESLEQRRPFTVHVVVDGLLDRVPVELLPSALL